MTSTELPSISRRLPPLPGLLDDMLGQALRARRRRVMMANNASLNLMALRVPDEALDQLVQGAAIYGQQAVAAADDLIGSLDGAAKDAAVFVRVALAVQLRDATLAQLAVRYLSDFPQAVRDACWFYPVTSGVLTDDNSHIVQLFNSADGAGQLRQFAVEMAGLRDVKSLHAQIADLLDDTSLSASAHIALTRMGAATDATQRFARDSLAAGEPTHCATAMTLIGEDPSIADDAFLQLALPLDPAYVEQAWAIAIARDARAMANHAALRADLASPLRARIVALTGFVDGVIEACAIMAQADGPISAFEADILQLTLGEVPVEARCAPNDKRAKSVAMRAALLRACRRAHLTLSNDADVCEWDIQEILATPTQAASMRLRNGAPLVTPVPVWDSGLMEVSHGLRKWLYIERAALAQHALPLSPFDVTRRQQSAMMVAAFSDEMSAI
ncbi:hypothetical protein [Massilia pseudoviolaceinigra]|uniref:hypothetical protein n=1 Tax=Massilia pseudoviolaceinigra TaxID=3057165 RepID=UPI002796CB5C|nr:hypothetical protein [Massilia sp. CCM 9206]MDQ1923462.1 hypothetical protein [Massilia sp. CCM 9206]